MRVSPPDRTVVLTLVFALVSIALPRAVCGLVPGTGDPIIQVGDDFEDPGWAYEFRLPKSSHNIDQQIREPGGVSNNGRWAESAKRGQPDLIRRVAPPAEGLAGSTGALLLQSRHTGVPGHASGRENQDDFLMRIRDRMGGHVPVSWSPSIVVRVFLPPWAQWENAAGASFGLRADVDGVRNGRQEAEEYWPGMFIRFVPGSKGSRGPSAHISVRAGEDGGDHVARQITETGWWTLGMSMTPDGRIHYYASPGVDDLTEQDHIASHYPYGFRCRHLDTVIFNIANRDSGQWSTPWIIDDPSVYFVRPEKVEAQRQVRRPR